MRSVWLFLGIVVLAGCKTASGSYSKPKSAADILAEEEQAAYEDELKRREKRDADAAAIVDGTSDIGKFDEHQAEIEMIRGERNAMDCPAVVGDAAKMELGPVTVKVTFSTEGAVARSEVSDPYAGTPMGTCILRAFESIKVPVFVGSSVTKERTFDLSKQKADDAAEE